MGVKTENKMAYEPVNKLIIQMSAPPLISMFFQYSYNLVDSMFVAGINEQALAAVSLAFPITTLMNALSVWIGVGVNVLIAGYLGQKKSAKGKFCSGSRSGNFGSCRSADKFPFAFHNKSLLFGFYAKQRDF